MQRLGEYQIAQNALHFNSIINGGCQVAQRVAPALSTTSQYGAVDRFRIHATGTAISAGTITQDTAASVGRTGNALHISGATITGTGIILIKHRIEARDALEYKNKIGSFSCALLHDVGSAINVTITIRKPTASDNFAAVTDIGNSGALSVASGVASTLKYEGVSMGDCAFGLEIEVKIECGAITTKNFRLADFQLNIGYKALTFVPDLYVYDLRSCMRFYEYCPDTQTIVAADTAYSRNNNVGLFKVVKRVVPTITALTGSIAGHHSNAFNSSSATTWSVQGEWTGGNWRNIGSGLGTMNYRVDAEL